MDEKIHLIEIADYLERAALSGEDLEPVLERAIQELEQIAHN